ncbi:unnamed protein product [Camellia sinensis]
MDDSMVFWKMVWKLKILSKIRVFAWKACLSILPVKANLIQKRIPISGCCEVCCKGVETVHHCLFGCEFAERVWMAAGLDHLWQMGLTSDFFDWVWQISLSHGSEVLSLVFSMCWGILHLNQMIFAKSKRWVESMASIALNRFSDFIHAHLNLSRMPTLVSSVVWLPPAVGVYKLNFDGAVGRAQHVSSLGAIAHNNLGQVMASLSE